MTANFRILFRRVLSISFTSISRKLYVLPRPVTATPKDLGLETKDHETVTLKNLLYKRSDLRNTGNFKFWKLLEEDAIENLTRVNSTNFDGVMMTFLRSEKLYLKAQSFLEYVSAIRQPNDITLANFMILASEFDEERKALEVYNKLNKTLFVIPTFLHLVVQGLCKTSRWKECVELLNQADEVYTPAWIQVAFTAFQYEDFETGRRLIQEIVDTNSDPRSSVYTTWLNLIKVARRYKDVEWLMAQLLDYMRKNEHILSLQNSMQIRNIFTRRFSSIIATVNMSRTGVCPSCGYTLECPKLSLEEHNELEAVMKDRLQQGAQQFELSHPMEFQLFLRFLKTAKPYDIVVDGLNLAYRQPTNDTHFYALQLAKVISFLCESGHRPIVLGKKHMWFWNKHLMTQVEHMAKCFYTDNLSQDDYFMLYAALHGGPETLLLTHDLLRDHHNFMNGKHKELFKYWAHSRLVFWEQLGNKQILEHHQQQPIRVQGNWARAWHIPYEKERPYIFQIPFRKQAQYWLCIQCKGLIS